MVDLIHGIQAIHTWQYILLVDPYVQVDLDQYENYVYECLRMGFCAYRPHQYYMDVSSLSAEERGQLQEFLQLRNLQGYVMRILRAEEEPALR
ncbi:MAG TPA: hypothetical protein VL461_14045 [Dictyobacter sp.]|jgi:hypothetical protein|nr:hypothetical protein [Dictyobacter sp.]